MTDHTQTSRPKVLGRVIGWLRAGYPQGIPKSDYVALFAVLHRHLTDYEVAVIVEELTAGKPDSEISTDDIEAAITRIAKEQPDQHDVARVASRLAAGGWPLDEPLSDAD
ncbi:DUF3349 domain-containing protein [Nocardia lijiangensis]|uniref:DUF3349 domain-containing protein n=1 Tax=Nocardia lijiangensis TaxID=299618 RepID=UPI000A01DFDE|nr:DUF3349 domain-containing protein [Nocardia lijiangensis]